MALPLWDKVKLDADERLDKPDASALQSMAAESLVNGIGGLLGWGGGCVTPPTATFSLTGSPKTIKLGGFQYYVCEPSLAESPASGAFAEVFKGMRGNIMKMDPSLGGQITDLSFDAIYAIAQANYLSPTATMYPFLYAQPYEVNTDADARIKWVTAETPTTMTTRTSIRHSFEFSTLPPEQKVGWAPILQIQWPDLDGTGPGAPSVRYISLWDNPSSQAFSDDTESFGLLPDSLTWPQRTTTATDLLFAKQNDSPVDNADIVSDGSPFMDVGLIQMVQILRSKIVRALKLDRTRYWYQKQAGSNPAIAVGTDTIIDDVATLYALPAIIAAGTVAYNGSPGYFFPVPAVGVVGTPALTGATPGIVRVLLDPAALAGMAIVAVQVTLYAYGGGNPASVAAGWWYALSGGTYVEAVLEDISGVAVNGHFTFTVVGRRV